MQYSFFNLLSGKFLYFNSFLIQTPSYEFDIENLLQASFFDCSLSYLIIFSFDSIVCK